MLVRERDGHRLLLTARTRTIEIDEVSGEVVLKLETGERVDVNGEPNYRRINFAQADIAFPRADR